jgi:hypothetical protein
LNRLPELQAGSVCQAIFPYPLDLREMAPDIEGNRKERAARAGGTPILLDIFAEAPGLERVTARC